ncbi:MAG: RDD family protein [Acidimicrobiales bacterium]|jgi:uncharacterized RDD family membrane protein YckC|nr:RDD family protein [Acidimicrobiales bacterium]
MSDLPPPPGAPPPPPGPAASQPSSAGFGARLGAYIIDYLVVGIPAGILIFIGFEVAPTEIETCTVDGQFGLCEVPTGAGWGIIAITFIAALIGIIYYFGKLEGEQGQTIGKKAVNIRTVDSTTGQPIGFGRGVGRLFGRWISGIPCSLGYLWMLWDPNQQTWHDKMVSSRVVNS